MILLCKLLEFFSLVTMALTLNNPKVKDNPDSHPWIISELENPDEQMYELIKVNYGVDGIRKYPLSQYTITTADGYKLKAFRLFRKGMVKDHSALFSNVTSNLEPNQFRCTAGHASAWLVGL